MSLKRYLWAVALLGVAGGLAWAQPRPRPNAQKEELAAARPMLAERLSALDREIASRMLRRVGTMPDQIARLEMEIDWRILARWMLAQGQAAPVGGDVQVAAALRADLLGRAAATCESVLEKQSNKPAPGQMEALSSLHQLTFALPEAKDLKQLDSVSRRAGSVVAAFAGVDDKTLPALRPRPVRPPSSGPEQPDSVAKSAEELRRMNLSLPLRQQLTALVNAASKPVDGDKEREEARTLQRTLDTCVEIARALHHHVGVTPEARLQVETRLAEAVALFLDPRVRALGQERLAGMQDYRQAAARIYQLKLTPEQTARFAPLFAWAQQNPDQGGKSLGAVEKYSEVREKLATRSRKSNTVSGLQRSQDELVKATNQAAFAFENLANEVVKGNRTATDLEQAANEFQHSAKLVEAVESMPSTLEALGAYRPKGFANLERRVAAAASAAAFPNSPVRAQGIQLLENLDKLKTVAAELSQQQVMGLAPLIDARYGLGKTGAVTAQWKSVVAELASSAAVSGELDATKLARLDEAKLVCDVLKQAATIEAVMKDVGVLSQWVDWQMNVEELNGALAGYHQAVGDLVLAYTTNGAKAVEQWDKASAKYRGLVTMLTRAGAFRDQCAAFPTGASWVAAALLTPFENVPFLPERHVSFTLDVWQHAKSQGDEAADDALNTVLRRAR